MYDSPTRRQLGALVKSACCVLVLFGAACAKDPSPEEAEGPEGASGSSQGLGQESRPLGRLTDRLRVPDHPRYATADAYLDAIGRARKERQHRESIALMEEFCALYPGHGNTPGLVDQRWKIMCAQLDMLDQATTEMELLLEEGDLPRPLKKTLRGNLFLAYLGNLNADMTAGRGRDPKRLVQASAALERILTHHPADRRGARGLYDLARMYDGNDARQRELYAKIITLFPDSNYADPAAGWVRRSNSIGKPFDLFFEDALSAEQVDIAQYRGKVVLVSFWATWNPVCLNDLEDQKLLLEKYGERLAILGVNQDDSEARGGLAAMKNVVEGQAVSWPQYFQGSKWRGDFSALWGVNKIPTIFVIDPAGKLHSTDAHGRLDLAIEAALAEPGQ